MAGSILLLLVAIAFGIGGWAVLDGAGTIMHEIFAVLLWLIAAVLLSGAFIVDAIRHYSGRARRDEISRHLELLGALRRLGNGYSEPGGQAAPVAQSEEAPQPEASTKRAYRVTGIDTDSGFETDITVHAQSENDAGLQAMSRGLKNIKIEL